MSRVPFRRPWPLHTQGFHTTVTGGKTLDARERCGTFAGRIRGPRRYSSISVMSSRPL